jgi:hypothetical protein
MLLRRRRPPAEPELKPAEALSILLLIRPFSH